MVTATCAVAGCWTTWWGEQAEVRCGSDVYGVGWPAGWWRGVRNRRRACPAEMRSCGPTWRPSGAPLGGGGDRLPGVGVAEGCIAAGGDREACGDEGAAAPEVGLVVGFDVVVIAATALGDEVGLGYDGQAPGAQGRDEVDGDDSGVFDAIAVDRADASRAATARMSACRVTQWMATGRRRRRAVRIQSTRCRVEGGRCRIGAA